MKSKISLLVACMFLLSASFVFAMGAKEVSATGTLKTFTDTSLTVSIADANGKVTDVTAKINSSTKVTRVGQEMPWLDVARKGLTVALVYAGDKVVSVELPNYGIEARGQVSVTASGVVLNDTRVNSTDSNIVAPSERKDANGNLIAKVSFVEAEEVLDTVFALTDEKTLTLGNLNVVDGSVSIKRDGKDLTVVYGKDGLGKFASPLGSSVVVDSTKNETTILFDVPFTQTTTEELDAVVKLSFKKKTYTVTASEFSYMTVDPKVVVELNGKPATLENAVKLGNYSIIRCNADGVLIHLDAYFVEKTATVKAASEKEITLLVEGVEVKLAISAGVTVLTSTDVGTMADVKAGATVVVSTEPADGYSVVGVIVK